MITVMAPKAISLKTKLPRGHRPRFRKADYGSDRQQRERDNKNSDKDQPSFFM